MLDANEVRLKKIGSVTVRAGRIEIDGFSGENATYRDVAALAAVWAIGRLQRELMEILKRPGGGNFVV